MKKYLLASTMVAAIAGFSTSTSADTVINGSVSPKDNRLNIEISGQFTPTAWVGSQKIEFVSAANAPFFNGNAGTPIDKTRGYDFRNYYNRLLVRAYGKADDWDLNYEGHARFVLNGGGRSFRPNDFQTNSRNATFVDRLAVQLFGKWGFLEFGDDTSRLFKDNHYWGTISTGIGGWDSYLIGNEFLITSNTIDSSFPDRFESNFTKVTYKSPTFYGFSLGLTWTPDTSHRGDNPLLEINGAGGSFENVYDVSVEYINSFINDQLGVKILAAWQAGESEDRVNDVAPIEVFSVSGELAYNGFQVAGSFTDFNNSGISGPARLQGVDAGKTWNVGAAYYTGRWGISVGYENTNRNTGNQSAIINAAGQDTGQRINSPTEARLWAITAGIEFTLAPGLTTFLEFTHADNKDNTTVSSPLLLPGSGTEFNNRDVTAIPLPFQDNSGDFVVLGTKLKF